MVTLAPMRPASGSQGDHVLYGGGRRLKHRYEYCAKSKSAFVELAPSYRPTPENFKALLETIPGVMNVERQPRGKALGHHYCKQNLLVYSSTGPGSARSPIEFALTKFGHLKDGGGKDTVTAMLKGPPDGLIGEAWRILLAATTGKLLLPDWAQQYRKKHVALWEGKEPAQSLRKP